jgi:hypothetical protein
VLVGLSGGRLNTDGSGEAADDDLGDTELLEVFCQIGVVERAPGVLGDCLIPGLLVKFREKVRPASGEVRGPEAVLGAARGTARGPPRVFRTADLELFHAACCWFRYSSWTSCGVL